jgi:hypothetical protein
MHLTPRAGILVASAVASLEVLLRSLPSFPVYSLASAVDGGKGEGGTFPGTVVMQEHFGPVSGAYQVSSRLRYAFSCGLEV